VNLTDAVQSLPLVAILRGIGVDHALAVSELLFECGFKIIELPLNSPKPFDSIAKVAARLGTQALIGAGTVTQVADVRRVRDTGGTLIVMPHSDREIISEAKRNDLICLPGVATPTEGFAALAAGADGLKLFPAEMLGPSVVKALRAIFPPQTLFFPVGGISPDNMVAYWQAGASGFGIGSALYKPGMSLAQIKTNAERFAAAASKILLVREPAVP